MSVLFFFFFMDYSLLVNRKIIDVFIGDTIVYDNYTFPRLSGSDLCELSSSFGLPRTYGWGSNAQNKSRWEYMHDLLNYLISKDRVSDLLSFLFRQARFENLTKLGNVQKIEETYRAIAKGALDIINTHLLLSKVELQLVNDKFVLIDVGEDITFETPRLKNITRQYIKDLPNRIEEDFDKHDYDSVITKSRTLLEEVLIYIIEQKTSSPYKSNGDLVKIYQDATNLLNMRQEKKWDKRVNELLGGLHKLVSSISSMRNMSSDAHGVGSSRISIRKQEALLVANSSMMLSEYWLSVFEGSDL